MKKYPNIGIPKLSNVEAEKGEVIISPDGITYAIDGKSHAAGGTNIVAEQGAKILSKHVKLPENVVYALTGKEEKKSPSKLIRRTDKYSDILDSTELKYDELTRKTARMMFEKNKAYNDAVFDAQEEFKNSKKRVKGKALMGGPVGFDPFQNVPNFQVIQQPSMGYSTRENGIKTSYFEPFANDPYFTQNIASKRGKKLNSQDKEILRQRQETLSNLRTLYPTYGQQLEREYAKYINKSDALENDIYLKKEIVTADGQRKLLKDATDAEIDASKDIIFTNTRTGGRDIIDFIDAQNQGFYPRLKFQADPVNTPIQPLPSRDPRELPIPTPKLNIPPVNPQTPPEPTKRGLDWQSILNGTQLGLAAADLATLRTKPPYYDYTPSELAYTRFEPVNTKQQERAFNLAAQSLQNSNLPEQVKQAQLADLSAQMRDGINQIDINNYQGDLANDNRNIQLYTQVRNDDIRRQNDSNLRFSQESDRRNYMKDVQKQVLIDKMMNTIQAQVANRLDLALIGDLTRNYEVGSDGKVYYKSNQGGPMSFDQLKAYALPSQQTSSRK